MKKNLTQQIRDKVKEEVSLLKKSKTKTIKINEPELAESKVIDIGTPITTKSIKYESIISNAIEDDIGEAKSEISKLVSSVKAMQFEERYNKKKRWKSALRNRRRYF